MEKVEMVKIFKVNKEKVKMTNGNWKATILKFDIALNCTALHCTTLHYTAH
jgi:hypothetical protein